MLYHNKKVFVIDLFKFFFVFLCSSSQFDTSVVLKLCSMLKTNTSYPVSVHIFYSS